MCQTRRRGNTYDDGGGGRQDSPPCGPINSLILIWTSTLIATLLDGCQVQIIAKSSWFKDVVEGQRRERKGEKNTGVRE